jgi:hypothetical protein
MPEILCWHRAKVRGKILVCVHCGVAVEECPCVVYRVPDGACVYCNGSGYVAILRGNREKFAEYLTRDAS